MPSSNCTITVLPDVLTCIHIPRSRLQQFSHYLVKQILKPAPSFLNITCNRTDLLLFAHYSALQDFEPFALRDQRRHRHKPNRVSFHPSNTGPRRSSITSVNSVEISYDIWSVLQLDSHNDRLDNAGARIRELSATLAEAGISIMYQSSYTSDFIFVKSSRLPQVLARLAQAGFVGYSFDNISPPLNNGFPFTPLEKRHDAASPALVLEHNPNFMPLLPCDAEFNRTYSQKSRGSKSIFNEVEILNQDLVCVGLPESFTDMWSLKIIKLVAYPELILTPSSNPVSGVDMYDDASDLSSSSVDGVYSNGRSSLDLPLSNREDFCIHSPVPFYSPSHITLSLNSGNEGVPVTTQAHSTFNKRSSPLQYSRSLPEINSMGKLFFQHTRRTCKSTTVHGDTSPSFFSFTRTAEGSSLTTSRRHIAALFPESERHMIICGEELNFGDEKGGVEFSDYDSSDLAVMRCLQLDIQQFGADRHGIISNCSRILDSNGINHMYSSTYKTANVLVNRMDAHRAAALLRSW